MTVCATVFDVLVAKLASPLYTAVRLCRPALKFFSAHTACAEPFSATFVHPEISLPPSLNVIVPVGVPGADSFAVAVKVTICPTVEGLIEEVSAVVVACRTICVNPPDPLAPKLVSPPYAAVIVCDPSASALVEHCACAAPFNATLTHPEISTPPSLNVIVPVGEMGALAFTVAVKVIVCPARAGVAEVDRLIVVGYTEAKVRNVGPDKLPLPAPTKSPKAAPVVPLKRATRLVL